MRRVMSCWCVRRFEGYVDGSFEAMLQEIETMWWKLHFLKLDYANFELQFMAITSATHANFESVQ